MRKAVTLLPLVLLLAGCDAASGGQDGPLALGIVSGNHQTVTAGAEQLPDPVTAKVVRAPGGGITLRLVTPAYAQGTVVSGSPVPGAVVCAVSITEDAMEPFTPCTNTDSSGQATFFFTPPTKVGTPMSEIRGTVAGEPSVFDTASATVVAGPPATIIGQCAAGPCIDGMPFDPWTDTTSVYFGYRYLDQYGNLTSAYRVEGTGWLQTMGDTIGTRAALTLKRVGSPALGDTTTVRVIGAGGTLLMDGVGTMTEASHTRGEEHLKTWAVNVVSRADWIAAH